MVSLELSELNAAGLSWNHGGTQKSGSETNASTVYTTPKHLGNPNMQEIHACLMLAQALLWYSADPKYHMVGSSNRSVRGYFVFYP